MHASAINYMLRRLILAAARLERLCDRDGLGGEHLNRMLREHLRETLALPPNLVEPVHSLLKECLLARKREPSKRTCKEVRAEAERAGPPLCYLCGTSVTFATTGEDDSAEFEHVWPRGMGGASEAFNLRVSCHLCNQRKRDRIDGADFHFEAVCLVCLDQDDENFMTEFTNDSRVAVRVHLNSKCARCGRAAERVGEMSFHRVDAGDAWHFFEL